MNRIQTIVEMIKVKSGMFGEREHVIAEYDSLVKYVGTLNMEVGAGAMSAFEHEIKNHITGKRIYDVLNGLLRSQDLLAKVIEENIDLDEVQRAIPACSGTVVGEPCGNRLTRDYLSNNISSWWKHTTTDTHIGMSVKWCVQEPSELSEVISKLLKSILQIDLQISSRCQAGLMSG